MSTGLTFGTISSLYGLNAGIIDETQFSLLVTVVVVSALAPTAIAERWFLPAAGAEKRLDRRSRISSRSSLVGRSGLRPASASACRSRFRSVSGTGSCGASSGTPASRRRRRRSSGSGWRSWSRSSTGFRGRARPCTDSRSASIPPTIRPCRAATTKTPAGRRSGAAAPAEPCAGRGLDERTRGRHESSVAQAATRPRAPRDLAALTLPSSTRKADLCARVDRDRRPVRPGNAYFDRSGMLPTGVEQALPRQTLSDLSRVVSTFCAAL